MSFQHVLTWDYYPCASEKKGQHIQGKGRENVMEYTFHSWLGKDLGTCRELECDCPTAMFRKIFKSSPVPLKFWPSL
jgi:hypothetical protein